ncbi:MAG: T9SS type A sorting domain-containing protein [Vicingaceae bacterium]
MKKIITILSVALLGFNASSQVVEDTAVMGAFYANQVYYSLANGEVATVSNTNWDLAFSASGHGAAGSAILINEGDVELYAYPGDTANWSTFDTTGYANWERLLNSDTSWVNGALNVRRGARGFFDMGWGMLNPQNNFWTLGDSLYLAKLSDDSYRKLWIVSLKTGVWEFKYANVDGSNEQTFTIDKATYPNRNFVYHSMETNTTIDREPDNTTWDLMFGKHTDYVFPPGMYVPVTGVFNNRNVWSAKAFLGDSATAAGATEAQTDLNQNVVNIGRTWKKRVQGNWVVYDSIAYFAYDNDSTNFYRIVFTGFESGFGPGNLGKAIFNTELLHTVGIEGVEKNMKLSMYPNPATDKVTLLLDYPENDVMNVELINLSGQIVYREQLNLNAGINQKTIRVDNLQSGIYLLNIVNAEFKSTQKLIVR